MTDMQRLNIVTDTIQSCIPSEGPISYEELLKQTKQQIKAGEKLSFLRMGDFRAGLLILKDSGIIEWSENHVVLRKQERKVKC